MGAIVSGPLSNGLNITQACITHTQEYSGGGGGRENLGNGSQAGDDIDFPRGLTPWEGELCWAYFHSPGGPLGARLGWLSWWSEMCRYVPELV